MIHVIDAGTEVQTPTGIWEVEKIFCRFNPVLEKWVTLVELCGVDPKKQSVRVELFALANVLQERKQ